MRERSGRKARGVYYSEDKDLTYGLKKGGYYLVYALRKVDDLTFPTQSYSLTVDYKPSVPVTKLKSVSKTRKGLSIGWIRVNGVEGYQLEYSTKEDFSSKKKTAGLFFGNIFKTFRKKNK